MSTSGLSVKFSASTKNFGVVVLLFFAAWNAASIHSLLWSTVSSGEDVSSLFSSSYTRIGDPETKSCPQNSRQPLLDPFSDLRFSSPDLDDNNVSKSYFSSHHCVGTGLSTLVYEESTLQTDADSYARRRPNYANRQCHYRNLYYRIEDQTFHYFPSPEESALWRETKELNQEAYNETLDRMSVSLGNIPEALNTTHTDWSNYVKEQEWRPVIHDKRSDPSVPPSGASFVQVDAPQARRTVFTLYRPFHSFNFGHLLWDDFLGLFSLLDRFNLGQNDDDRMIPFYVEHPNKKQKTNFGGHDPLFRCGPNNPWKWEKCVKLYSRVFPDFMRLQPDQCSGDILRTGNWLRGEDNIGDWTNHPKDWNCTRTSLPTQTVRNEPPPNAEYILLPHVFAGTGRTGEFGCEGDCAIGRTQEYTRFRDFLFRNVLGPKDSCELHQKRPKGFITFSLSGKDSHRRGQLRLFNKEIVMARQKFGDDLVKAVDMSTLSVQDQITLLRDTAVLVTNQGGVAAASTFLPRGGAAIVFWHGEKRMDHTWFESAGYFRTVWVGKNERYWLNRTMALIDDQLTKAKIEWDDQAWLATE